MEKQNQSPHKGFKNPMETTLKVINVAENSLDIIIGVIVVAFLISLIIISADDVSTPQSFSHSVVKHNGVIINERNHVDNEYDSEGTLSYLRKLLRGSN